MGKLILIRHGQSLWNLNNLFTGWVDIPLSEKGISEALQAGESLKDVVFDYVYVSTLMRAQQTAMLLLSKNKSSKIPVMLHNEQNDETQKKISQWSQIHSDETKNNVLPVYTAWQLNERYYGHLQGLNKDETRKKYGEEQVHIWRRSYDVPPPEGEALKNTAERTIPYFEKEILPHVKNGKNILLAAHGNSLRSIVMFLDKLSTDEVLKLEIKTGDPLEYIWENNALSKKKP